MSIMSLIPERSLFKLSIRFFSSFSLSDPQILKYFFVNLRITIPIIVNIKKIKITLNNLKYKIKINTPKIKNTSVNNVNNGNNIPLVNNEVSVVKFATKFEYFLFMWKTYASF